MDEPVSVISISDILASSPFVEEIDIVAEFETNEEDYNETCFDLYDVMLIHVLIVTFLSFAVNFYSFLLITW